MARPPLQHGDTETRLKGFDAVLEGLFERTREHGRALAIGLGIVLVMGTATALLYDSARGQEEEAASALAAIEVQFGANMGAPIGEPLPPEPANVEVARRAREAALEELELLIAEREGSRTARIAAIRAAEMEIDLGRLEAASERLEALSAELAADDPKRAIALRLAGYVLDERGEPLAAAQSYERGAEVRTYPGRPMLLVAAAEAYERAGEYQKAIAAYQQSLSVPAAGLAPAGVLRRIEALEYLADGSDPGSNSASDSGPDPAPDPGSDKEHSVK